jgi:predicted TPR repeat methyltransferase
MEQSRQRAAPAGRLDEALDSYQRALQFKPDYAEAHCNRAIVLQDMGRYLDALGAAEDALNIKTATPMRGWRAATPCTACAICRKRWRASTAPSTCGPTGRSPARRVLAVQAGRIRRGAGQLRPGAQAPAGLRAGPLPSRQCPARAGRREEAIAAYRAALAHGDNPETIAFALASVGEGETPAALPNDYVRSLFDQYANHFDQHLTEVLGYKTPAVLDALLRHVAPSSELNTVDLGCGTGLCAPYLRASRRLHGVDLSQQMLDKAAERKLYDELACADLTGYLAGREGAYDLAVAADVFVYIGDLAPVFRAVHAALRPGGRFCFSVEAGDGADYVLRPPTATPTRRTTCNGWPQQPASPYWPRKPSKPVRKTARRSRARTAVMQIDHIFIRVQPGGAEAEALRELRPERRLGQCASGPGTANRRFFFANAFRNCCGSPTRKKSATGKRGPPCCTSALARRSLAIRHLLPPRRVPHVGLSARLPARRDDHRYRQRAPLSEPMWFYLRRQSAGAVRRRTPSAAAAYAGLHRITGLRCSCHRRQHFRGGPRQRHPFHRRRRASAGNQL